MKTIGIDLRVLAKKEQGGISQYLENLIPRLIEKGGDAKFKFFYNGWRKEILEYPWLKSKNIEIYDSKIPNRVFDLLRLKIDKMMEGVDLFFSPHFLISPTTRKTKKVITVHDLSFLHYPNFFDLKRKFWHFRINPRKQIKSANHIIAVSNSTKTDLIKTYNIEPEKISVVYSGIDEKFKPLENNELNKKILNEVKLKYKLPNKFVLYLGKIEPRKNIVNLIKAFEALKTKGGSDLNLVIAGEKGWLHKKLEKILSNSIFARNIIITGEIDEQDKVYAYNLADIFAYPSFFEGFGFPPLEAMACGIPTIISNQTSLPEINGTSAIMVNPFKINEIEQAISILDSSPTLKTKYRNLGLKNAQKYDWGKTAEQTLEVFYKTLGQN